MAQQGSLQYCPCGFGDKWPSLHIGSLVRHHRTGQCCYCCWKSPHVDGRRVHGPRTAGSLWRTGRSVERGDTCPQRAAVGPGRDGFALRASCDRKLCAFVGFVVQAAGGQGTSLTDRPSPFLEPAFHALHVSQGGTLCGYRLFPRWVLGGFWGRWRVQRCGLWRDAVWRSWTGAFHWGRGSEPGAACWRLGCSPGFVYVRGRWLLPGALWSALACSVSYWPPWRFPGSDWSLQLRPSQEMTSCRSPHFHCCHPPGPKDCCQALHLKTQTLCYWQGYSWLVAEVRNTETGPQIEHTIAFLTAKPAAPLVFSEQTHCVLSWDPHPKPACCLFFSRRTTFPPCLSALWLPVTRSDRREVLIKADC